MIGMLKGRVESVDTSNAVVDVHGVGFELRMPSNDLTAMHMGQDVKIYTSMSVSQDAITLFGFLDARSKRMFLQLQKVSGVGPKVALSLLSTLAPDDLAQAIHDGDDKALSRAPGLGRKGAQKIILELKGSIDVDKIETGAPTSTQRTPTDKGVEQVVEGLMSLDWKQADAQQAVDSVISSNGIPLPLEEASVPTVLRLALTSLDRGR